MSAREAERDRDTRVVYTCWPIGSQGYMLCGILLMVIGGGMLAETIFPQSSQAIWGVALILVGVWAVTRSRQEGDPW